MREYCTTEIGDTEVFVFIYKITIQYKHFFLQNVIAIFFSNEIHKTAI